MIIFADIARYGILRDPDPPAFCNEGACCEAIGHSQLHDRTKIDPGRGTEPLRL